MKKKEFLEMCERIENNNKRQLLIEKRLSRLENMIREEAESRRKKSLVERYKNC